MLLPDGLTVYRGNFEGEKFQGNGILYNSRFKYKGDFNKGDMEGQGKLIIRDLYTYIGAF